jgi:hypothetical protein
VASLRRDDFDTFFAHRTNKLLDLIYKAIGKPQQDQKTTGIAEAFNAPLILDFED